MLPALGLYGHIRNNNLKSALLLAGFGMLMAVFWYSLCVLWTGLTWTPPGAPSWLFDDVNLEQRLLAVAAHAATVARATWYLPLIAGLAWLAIAYTFHAGMIRVAMGTKPLTRREMPKLYDMVERLAIGAGLPAPRIELMNTGALNAYAAGLSPETATIAVTRGLLKTLTPAELEAVLAHEMTHIRNHDVRLMVVATVFAGGLTFLGEMTGRMFRSSSDTGWHIGDIGDVGSGLPGLDDIEAEGPATAAALFVTVISVVLAICLLATVHMFALLTKFAISRSREYLADAGAVELTKNPDALISALLKISGHDAVPRAPASLCAMMISNPFDGLFSTHPSIQDRVEKLQRLAGGQIVEDAPRGRWGQGSSAQEPASESNGPWSGSSVPQAAAGFFPAGAAAAFGRRRPRLRGRAA